MAEEFFIPKLGQTVEEVTLIEWKVRDGDRVKVGQEVLDVETDKAVFAVEALADGHIHFGPFKEGDVVPVLAVVAVIGGPDETFDAAVAGAAASSPLPAAAAAEPAIEPEAVAAPAVFDAADTDRIFASPRARKLAEAKGVDLARVTPSGGGGVRVREQDVVAYLELLPKVSPVAKKMAEEAGIDPHSLAGTGPGGRVTKADVERAVAAAMPKQPEPEPLQPALPAVPPPAPVVPALPDVDVLERVPLKGVRGIIAERMATSVHTTARVTLVIEADATAFVEMRERLKAKVGEAWGFAPGYNDLLARIVAQALRKYPYINARLTADAVEHLAHVNLGMAVDTERGLLVPVIRDADRKGLRQFGSEFRELVDRARRGRSLPADLAGGTFTITNLGMYDIAAFTPVINLPEAAILGVGAIAPKVVPFDGDIAIRQMWTLSLVFDHRLVDGAPAARFLQHIKQVIEEPYLLLAE